MFSTAIAGQILEFIFILNVIFATLVVFFERRSPSATLTWLMVLFFIPVLGFVLYIFLGQDLRKKKIFFLKKEEEYKIFPLLELQDELIHANKLVLKNQRINQYRDLIQLHLNSNQAFFSQDNKLEIFVDGRLHFEDLLASLKKARVYIHLQYYIIRNDGLGRQVLNLLVAKAREGVEVRLLYDGMGCMRLPRNFFRPLLEAGGHVASFFPPFLPYINLRINYRNHRKICVIDGRQAYVGGFNIGDEYLGLSKLGYWRDTHIRIEGSAVMGLAFRFLLDWRFAARDYAPVDEKYFPYYNTDGETGIQIVSSGPDSRWAAIKDGFLKMISSAQQRLYIQTPYFIPDESILEALKVAALSGVDVRLVIPEKEDHLFVHWASLSYVGELLEAGVSCYTYKKGFIHSKMMVMDSFISTVGTANLDIRSFNLNFEVNAFIYDEDISTQLEAIFMRDLDDCEELTREQYLQRSVNVKIKEAFSGLLSPLSSQEPSSVGRDML